MKYFRLPVWTPYLILAALQRFSVLKCSCAMDTYSFEYENFPNVGYACPTDGRHTLKSSARHCILHCLQTQVCSGLNYNRSGELCVLLPAPCTIAPRKEGMEYTVFTGRNHDQCLKWVPVAEINLSSDRVVESSEGFLACRLKIKNATIPGHYGKHWNMCWATDGNGQRASRSHPSEMLTIASECTAGWVNYTAGTPLPPSVIVAGRSYAGDNLYVAMLRNPPYIITGYYDVGAGMGYTSVDQTVYQYRKMDLLILL